ncbi:PrpF domain-containing protein [Pseudarthrobacter sp. GA104]|uniref:PrpF domain-containing protein n=1 Tax=Pseudarthrobacter sp. GA104 TaxID=2676311 RepID=UPI0018D252C6|nr:PrpF domain-containing protein [Pseudarthrobacter sp. GA104]
MIDPTQGPERTARPTASPGVHPAAIYRGGTSKGVLFRAEDVPPLPDDALEDWVRAVMGSSDPRQIDGLGGADLLTSKFGIVGPSKDPTYDVDFTFFQVGFREATIARDSACGNLSSAAALFSIDEGIVRRGGDGRTFVRIRDVNTEALILAEVDDRQTPGLNGETGTAVWLDFASTAGSTTGSLLPTGNACDTIDVDGLGQIEVTIVDLANLVAYVRAQDVGVGAHMTPDAIESDPVLMNTLEKVRGTVAAHLGMCPDWRGAASQAPGVPFLALISNPSDAPGNEATSLQAVGFAMRSIHRAYWVTGGVCTAVAAQIKGSIPNSAARIDAERPFRLRHPAGFLEVQATVTQGSDEHGAVHLTVNQARLFRTARRIMTGHVAVPGY